MNPICKKKKKKSSYRVIRESRKDSWNVYLLQHLPESTVVNGIGIAKRAIDVEQYGFQRSKMRQGASAASRGMIESTVHALNKIFSR